MIYKGRIDADKLPAVDMNKKNSVVLLAPPGKDLVWILIQCQFIINHLLTGNDQERNGLSPIIPNIEPALPREESFT